MRRPLAIAIVAALLFLLGISAYFLLHSSSSDRALIRIGVLKHESSLPIYIADELHLFENHDVHAQLVELPPGDHMPALLSERVDILSPTSFPLLFGVIKQSPNSVYAVFPGAEVLGGPTVYGIIVRNDFAGSNINDLRKEVVMAINPYTAVNIRTILSSAKIPENEWPEIRVASRESALGAVSNGTARAAIMDQPALAVALASANYRLLESNPRARYIGSPYWSGAGAVLQQKWLDNRETFMKLMAAVDDAIARIDDDPEAAHLVLARRLGINEHIASQMGGYYFPKSKDTVPMDGIRATVAALVSAGLLSGPVDLKSFFPPGLYGEQ